MEHEVLSFLGLMRCLHLWVARVLGYPRVKKAEFLDAHVHKCLCTEIRHGEKRSECCYVSMTACLIADTRNGVQMTKQKNVQGQPVSWPSPTRLKCAAEESLVVVRYTSI